MNDKEIQEAFALIGDMQDTLRWYRKNTNIKKGVKSLPKLSNPKMDLALSLIYNTILKLAKEK